MSVAIFDGETEANIKAVKEHAEANPFTEADGFKMMTGQMPAPGNIPGFFCSIPIGIKAVYSIGTDYKGTWRILSVSVKEKDKFPSVALFSELMKMFGFKKDFHEIMMDGKLVIDSGIAIKAVEPYENL